MTPTRDGMVDLDRSSCLRRLAQVDVGRIATTVGALPTIFPVSYSLLDEDIVFRAQAGTTLAAAVLDAVIAFEIDHVDGGSAAGWSIVVVGHAREVVGAPDGLRLSTERMTGRSFGPPIEDLRPCG